MYDEDSSINGTKLRAYNQTVIVTLGGAGSWADELHTAYNNKDKVKSAILLALPTMPSAGDNDTEASWEAIISHWYMPSRQCSHRRSLYNPPIL